MYGGGGGGGPTFDDGTPLSFYRQQVAKMHGRGGGGGRGGGYGNGSGAGGYSGGGMGGYMSQNGGGGRAGRQRGSGRGSKPPGTLNQLYTNSFRYPNMLMGGGFMQPGDGYGPHGKHTSEKWRGYGKVLVSSGGGGYGSGGDKLTQVKVVPSGATDEYKDSYLTMIADTVKQQGQAY